MTSPAPLLFDLPPIDGDAPSRASSLSGTPASWPFQGLVPARYRLIAADPAWLFALRSPKGEGKAPQAHYDCMPLDAIKALPVGQLADRRGCLLWLWGTWAMLPEALETGRAWGFRYVTGFPWVKRTVSGKLAFGPGYVVRVSTEHVTLWAIGDPPYGPGCKSERGILLDGEVLDAATREHSRKPDEQYAMARRLIPEGPACELFARQSWPGWDVWGNQTDKFQADAGAVGS
ncbi:MT-A70 family methyltransferase [Azospirillum doebereinerae]|uniref:MT-A70 family methyltransferase n=1 Tax=Azospirillum doebereinerae TaxID=92933 RepID=UPI001EE50ECE|nr:MT-A70 family methyltransferase [Azospirillum doebereinerae]MCG5239541.1 MT-A70 family methyltransferase [Azospirillum doebereinerae]